MRELCFKDVIKSVTKTDQSKSLLIGFYCMKIYLITAVILNIDVFIPKRNKTESRKMNQLIFWQWSKIIQWGWGDFETSVSLQCDDIRRWDLWEVIRFRWSRPWGPYDGISVSVRKGEWKLLSCVPLFGTPRTHAAHHAPPFMGFSRQEYWSGLPFPSPGDLPNPGIEPESPAL